jgi:SAM-dependent methyltransferase
MFNQLEEIFSRPKVFEFYTAKELWTDSHTAQQMLMYHLNPEVDLSSRKLEFIERSVAWILDYFSIQRESRIADFGCGPGLYTNRLARHCGNVTGIDFSAHSIAHAKERAEIDGLPVRYVTADYLGFETGQKFDLIMMIMCDFCALSPEQREHMLAKFHSMLNEGGRLLFDAYSLHAFEARAEGASFAENLLDGFWSEEDYYGFLNTFKYVEEKVMLDKYTIIERDRSRTVYNWLQYFSPVDLLEQLRGAGFSERTLFSDVAGLPFDDKSHEFAIVARK